MMKKVVMEQKTNPYYTITAESELREKERLWEKTRHDETQALHHAKKERDIEIAQKLPKRNRPIDEIVEDTGLTYEEIENMYSLYGKFQNSIKMLMQR